MSEFFAALFELGGNVISVAADDLYDFVYMPVGWFWIFFTIFSFVMYYYVVNSSKYNRPLHWTFVLLLNAIIITLFAFLYANGVFQREELDYFVSEFIEFIIMVFLYSLLLFFLLSLTLKRWSRNCRRTPF